MNKVNAPAMPNNIRSFTSPHYVTQEAVVIGEVYRQVFIQEWLHGLSDAALLNKGIRFFIPTHKIALPSKEKAKWAIRGIFIVRTPEGTYKADTTQLRHIQYPEALFNLTSPRDVRDKEVIRQFYTEKARSLSYEVLRWTILSYDDAFN